MTFLFLAVLIIAGVIYSVYRKVKREAKKRNDDYDWFEGKR